MHRFLTPMANTLRRVRIDAALDMYNRSAFLRYLEEALAEGWGQLVNRGWAGPVLAFKGVWFPLTGGYITLSQVITGGNLVGTITLGGMRIYVFVSTGRPPAEMQEI